MHIFTLGLYIIIPILLGLDAIGSLNLLGKNCDSEVEMSYITYFSEKCTMRTIGYTATVIDGSA